ncbi:MAG: hypothetical protein LUD74_03605 [Tannerellaceae bacterium]|nr:hypothetical protein [Tannerellaceae bacterium]
MGETSQDIAETNRRISELSEQIEDNTNKTAKSLDSIESRGIKVKM